MGLKRGNNKQQADNHHYPASDRQTPKTTKEKIDKVQKKTCKTEYLMV
jgi:hypothetical protein